MRERYIPAFITLLSGTIISIINIIKNVELVTGLKRLILVLIIFYILGSITKSVISRANKLKPKETEKDLKEEPIEDPLTDENSASLEKD